MDEREQQRKIRHRLAVLQARMSAKSVRSVIVTKPTGELVGVYHSTTTPPP